MNQVYHQMFDANTREIANIVFEQLKNKAPPALLTLKASFIS